MTREVSETTCQVPPIIVMRKVKTFKMILLGILTISFNGFNYVFDVQVRWPDGDPHVYCHLRDYH